MLESTFYNNLAGKLRKKDWRVNKISQGRFGSGFPDSILIDPEGEVIFLELKVGSNKLSALQKKNLREIDKLGAISIVGRFCGEATFITIQEAEGEILDKDHDWTRTRQHCQTLKKIWEDKIK